MKARIIIVVSLCLLACTAAVPAQENDQQQENYTGVVIDTNVYVRSGPDTSAYPCTKLSNPDRVTVTGGTKDWLRIQAPAGCFSAIAKRFVDLDEDGKSGTINSDGQWLRAGGDLPTPGFYAIQVPLQRGQKLQIIGEVGDYYKVPSPPDAAFWIARRYVKTDNDQIPIQDDQQAQPAEALPADTIDGKPSDGPTPTPPPAPTKADPREVFTQAEKDLLEEFKTPPEQRDYQAVLRKYQDIDAEGDKVLLPYVQARISYLQAIIDLQQDVESAQGLIDQVRQSMEQYDAERAKLAQPQPPDKPTPPPPAGMGILKPSSIYVGTPATPRRYVLIDPQTRTIVAYVQASYGRLDLESFVGKEVEVYGPKSFERDPMIYVIEARHVVVIYPEGVQIPPPPRPTVKPPRLPLGTPPQTTAPVEEQTVIPQANQQQNGQVPVEVLKEKE